MCKKFSLTDDLRGKDHIRIDLSGTTKLKQKWKKAVINNLCSDANSIKNWNQIAVNINHWAVKELHNLHGVQKNCIHQLQ